MISNNTFRHSGSLGDIIFSLPAVMALGGGTYFLRDDMARSLKRLLEIQPYLKIEVVNDTEWKALKVSHDLDKFRGTSELHVVDMHLKAFDLDFSNRKNQYLFNVPAKRAAKIVINDTGSQRFPGNTIDWDLLKPYEKDCIFLGNDHDYNLFLKDRNLKVARCEVDDLFEFAQVINGSDLLVCNMSVGQTMAEGMKKPYAVDLYVGKPQYPLSEQGHTGLCEAVFKWYVSNE